MPALSGLPSGSSGPAGGGMQEASMSNKFEKAPIVFHFQPEEYEVLETPEQVKDWERMMMDDVGIDNLTATALSGTPTSCTCHGGLLDDADYIRH
jgi:hypothetical protein